MIGSHLLLGEKTLRPAEGGNPNSFGKFGGNQWAALCAVRLYPPKKSLSSLLVPEVGFEPTSLAARDFESRMFANFITPAL